MIANDTIDADELEEPRHKSWIELKETVLHDPQTGEEMGTQWCVFPPSSEFREVCTGETPGECLRELADWLDGHPDAIYRAGEESR